MMKQKEKKCGTSRWNNLGRWWLAVVCCGMITACSSTEKTILPWMSTAVETPRLTPERNHLYQDLYQVAVNRRLQGKYDESFVLLQQALQINPQGADALFEMGMLCFHLESEGNSTVAGWGEPLLRRALQLDPQSNKKQRGLAVTLVEEGKFSAAIPLLKKIVDREMEDSDYGMLLMAYRETQQYEPLLQLLDRIEKREGVMNNIFLERYRTYIALKDTAKAYAALDHLCEANGGDPYFKVLKANFYHEQGYNDKALTVYQQVLQEDPKHAFGRISLMDFYKTLHEDSLYRQLFDDVVYDPALAEEERYNVLGQYLYGSLQEKQDTAKVLPVLRRVLTLPQESRRIGELCLMYAEAVQLPRAQQSFIYRAILDAEPDNVAARVNLIFDHAQQDDGLAIHQLSVEGRRYDKRQIAYYFYDALALAQLKRSAEAIEVLETGLAEVDSTQNIPVQVDMWSILGDLYHEIGEKDKAYTAYDKVLAMDEDNLSCLNNYAYFLSKDRSNLEKAETMSRKTIEAEPQNAVYLDTYAWILYEMGRYTQAKIYILECLKHITEEEGNATLFDHAGDISYRCGEVDFALAYWKKALQLTDDPEVKKVLQRKLKRRRI